MCSVTPSTWTTIVASVVGSSLSERFSVRVLALFRWNGFLYSPIAFLTSSSKEASAPSNSYPSFSSFLRSFNIAITLSSLGSSSTPSSFALYKILLLPERSDIKIRLLLPTTPGSTCSYVVGSFITALTWMPPLCAKALSPTKASCFIGGRLVSSWIKCETSYRFFNSPSSRQSTSSFNLRLGMMEHRLAFPHRSP